MTDKIPTPTKGQPIDASFLYKLVDKVNEIVVNVDNRKGKTYVQPKKATSSVRSTANSSFHASTWEVFATSSEVTTSTVVPIKISFSGIVFDGPPVVSATPIIDGEATPAAKSAIVTISDINKAECQAHVSFTTSGTVKNLFLHVIAVGNIS